MGYKKYKKKYNPKSRQSNETIAEKNLREYLELQEKVKNHNPLPVRKTPSKGIKTTEDKNSNFINVNGKYFNKGSKKGCDVNSASIKYLQWVYNNVDLNKSELKLLKKVLNKMGGGEDI